ncbi:MAG: Acetyltransferase family [Deltaproteobacteria bacterium]|nr:Acetyltransferase family [Deltaproteobacteria bacterium]
MRQATESDLDFLADCYVKIARHMKAGEHDFYIARLPETADETIRNHVRRYVSREDALTLLEEVEGSPVACSSSFSASRLDKSGHIAVCWVEPANRRSGIAAKLVSAAEDWFRQKEVGVVELSYMVKNELATISWQRLGYQPFRVFAYKEL